MEGKEMVPRGVVIDRIARDKRRIRTISGINAYMKKRALELGFDPQMARSRATVSNYVYGETAPDEDWMTLFALAFELTPEEMGELAYANTFRALTAA